MIKIKHLFVAMALLISSVAVMAQTETKTDDGKDYKAFPYMFVNVQGGIQSDMTTSYTSVKLISPNIMGSFGAFFTRVVGARIAVDGGWDKGAVGTGNGDLYYYYNHVNTDLDLMINVLNLFRKQNHKFNMYVIGGIGLNVAFNNEDACALQSYLDNTWDGTLLTHNARIGLMLDYDLSKHWSINAEGDFNAVSDRWNSKRHGADDWWVSARLGVSYKFGYKKKPVPQEVWETRIDTVWYDATEYKNVAEDGNMTWNVFYNIRESDWDSQIDNSAEAQLKSIGEFLKDHKECKISVESYADIKTGNPKINMEYSKQRNEKAVKALTDAGVASEIIANTGFYGDTVQPFAENDKNRCTIIKATGLKDAKVPFTVKKFRTEETRVRVQ